MCLACEEQALWWRYQLELAVTRGVIPDGVEAADFEALGLPVPGSPEAVALLAAHPPVGEAIAPADEPSTQVAPAGTAVPTITPAAQRGARPGRQPADAFVCEPADSE